MSEVSSSSVWNDDGPEVRNDESITPPSTAAQKSKSPPPLPSSKPVGNSSYPHQSENAAAQNDLIQFESEEERAATLNGFPTKPALAPKPVLAEKVATESTPKTMEEYMHDFLRDEGALTLQDYMKRFYQIRVEQDKFRMDPEYASDCAIAPQHFMRNRYRDILPYDYNRVEIEKDDENPDGYMNASFVQLPEGKTRFIAAQAPLPATLDEWWKMIDEHRVKLIVILCKLIEQNRIKCERYWPSEVGKSEIFGDYEITLEEEMSFEDDEYLLRKLRMQNQSNAESRIVHQLHYREWPDHGCPSGEKQLLNMVEKMSEIHESERNAEETPILVHCSAGVGRTGTIIAVNHIREQMNAGSLGKIDVFGLVMTLRRQRASMVQTQDQFQFVHRCIAAYCRFRLGIEEPKQSELPASPTELPTAMTSSVRLIAPPTPTNPDVGVVGSYQATNHEDDDSDATSVPDFPDEPPAPQGPEDLGLSAAK